jgi:hypothetical protein
MWRSLHVNDATDSKNKDLMRWRAARLRISSALEELPSAYSFLLPIPTRT